MKKLIACLVLILPASQALAEFPVGKVGVSLSPMVEYSESGVSEDADGSAIGFYGEIGSDMVFGYFEVNQNDLEVMDQDFDIDETRIGLGIRGSNETGFLEARMEKYEAELELEGVSGSFEDDGTGVHIGGGIPLNERAEIFGRFGFLSLDDIDGNEFRFGARGEMSTNVEVYGFYRMADLEYDDGTDADLDEFRLGLNLLF
jgi:hypothetical protein